MPSQWPLDDDDFVVDSNGNGNVHGDSGPAAVAVATVEVEVGEDRASHLAEVEASGEPAVDNDNAGEESSSASGLKQRNVHVDVHDDDDNGDEDVQMMQCEPECVYKAGIDGEVVAPLEGRQVGAAGHNHDDDNNNNDDNRNDSQQRLDVDVDVDGDGVETTAPSATLLVSLLSQHSIQFERISTELKNEKEIPITTKMNADADADETSGENASAEQQQCAADESMDDGSKKGVGNSAGSSLARGGESSSSMQGDELRANERGGSESTQPSDRRAERPSGGSAMADAASRIYQPDELDDLYPTNLRSDNTTAAMKADSESRKETHDVAACKRNDLNRAETEADVIQSPAATQNAEPNEIDQTNNLQRNATMADSDSRNEIHLQNNPLKNLKDNLQAVPMHLTSTRGIIHDESTLDESTLVQTTGESSSAEITDKEGERAETNVVELASQNYNRDSLDELYPTNLQTNATSKIMHSESRNEIIIHAAMTRGQNNLTLDKHLSGERLEIEDDSNSLSHHTRTTTRGIDEYEESAFPHTATATRVNGDNTSSSIDESTLMQTTVTHGIDESALPQTTTTAGIENKSSTAPATRVDGDNTSPSIDESTLMQTTATHGIDDESALPQTTTIAGIENISSTFPATRADGDNTSPSIDESTLMQTTDTHGIDESALPQTTASAGIENESSTFPVTRVDGDNTSPSIDESTTLMQTTVTHGIDESALPQTTASAGIEKKSSTFPATRADGDTTPSIDESTLMQTTVTRGIDESALPQTTTSAGIENESSTFPATRVDGDNTSSSIDESTFMQTTATQGIDESVLPRTTTSAGIENKPCTAPSQREENESKKTTETKADNANLPSSSMQKEISTCSPEFEELQSPPIAVERKLPSVTKKCPAVVDADALQWENEELKARLHRSKADLAKKDKKIETLKRTRMAPVVDANALRWENDELKVRLHYVKTDLAKKEKEIETLKRRVTPVDGDGDGDALRGFKIDELKVRLHYCKADLAEKEKELAEREKEMETLKRVASSRMSRVCELTEQLKCASEEKRALAGKLGLAIVELALLRKDGGADDAAMDNVKSQVLEQPFGVDDDKMMKVIVEEKKAVAKQKTPDKSTEKLQSNRRLDDSKAKKSSNNKHVKLKTNTKYEAVAKQKTSDKLAEKLQSKAKESSNNKHVKLDINTKYDEFFDDEIEIIDTKVANRKKVGPHDMETQEVCINQQTAENQASPSVGGSCKDAVMNAEMALFNLVEEQLKEAAPLRTQRKRKNTTNPTKKASTASSSDCRLNGTNNTKPKAAIATSRSDKLKRKVVSSTPPLTTEVFDFTGDNDGSDDIISLTSDSSSPSPPFSSSNSSSSKRSSSVGKKLSPPKKKSAALSLRNNNVARTMALPSAPNQQASVFRPNASRARPKATGQLSIGGGNYQATTSIRKVATTVRKATTTVRKATPIVVLPAVKQASRKRPLPTSSTTLTSTSVIPMISSTSSSSTTTATSSRAAKKPPRLCSDSLDVILAITRWQPPRAAVRKNKNPRGKNMVDFYGQIQAFHNQQNHSPNKKNGGNQHQHQHQHDTTNPFLQSILPTAGGSSSGTTSSGSRNQVLAPGEFKNGEEMLKAMAFPLMMEGLCSINADYFAERNGNGRWNRASYRLRMIKLTEVPRAAQPKSYFEGNIKTYEAQFCAIGDSKVPHSVLSELFCLHFPEWQQCKFGMVAPELPSSKTTSTRNTPAASTRNSEGLVLRLWIIVHQNERETKRTGWLSQMEFNKLLGNNNGLTVKQDAIFTLISCGPATNVVRQFEAIKCLPHLKPHLQRALFASVMASSKPASTTKPKSLPMDIWKPLTKTHNSYQLSSISQVLTGSHENICLVQGPPGTGKSSTITGLVSALLSGKAPLPGQRQAGCLIQPGKTMGVTLSDSKARNRILVCAATNQAVDHLAWKIRRESIGTSGIVGDFSMARYGSLPWERSHDSKDQKPESLSEMEEFLYEINIDRRVSEAVKVSKQEDEKERNERNEMKHVNKKRKRTLGRATLRANILGSCSVVFATLSGAGSQGFIDAMARSTRNDSEFDAVIIDEACQASEPESLIPFKYNPTTITLVGDPKQLPVLTISNISSNKKLLERSLFERLHGLNFPTILLRSQYRMHEEISAFPSAEFYDGKLVTPNSVKEREPPVWSSPCFPPICFWDTNGRNMTPGPHGHGYTNKEEADFITRSILSTFAHSFVQNSDIELTVGIISFYKDQVQLLKERLAQFPALQNSRVKVKVATVDGFQGSECDIIILSCVRSYFSSPSYSPGGQRRDNAGVGFLSDSRRLNVALTRAKCSLWIVGNAEVLKGSKLWRRLIRHMDNKRVIRRGNEFSKLIAGWKESKEL